VLKSPSKQLMHAFLHYVVSLQSKIPFFDAMLVVVLDVNIHPSSLRLLKVNLVVSCL